MRWCRCNTRCNNDVIIHELGNIKEIENLENVLRLRRKELLRADKILRHKEKQLSSLDRKTTKLIEYKNKVPAVLEKCKSCKKRLKNNKRKKAEPVDMVHKFFDKIFQMDKDMQKVAKINKYDMLKNIKRIFVPPSARARLMGSSRIAQNRRPMSNREKLFYAPKDCYIMSLQRTPQLWIYHRWPRFYPYYLDARTQWRHLGTCCMFLLGILFWVPCFVCLEIFKCCFCSCCCDC